MERDHQTTLPVVLITWCLSVGSISRTLAAESQVIGSPQPIIAVAGDDVTLRCSLEPPFNVEKLTVEWSRPDLHHEYVHVYRNGHTLVDEQHPSYINRTSLFEGELIHGNISLKLFRVKLEDDEGNYTCFIPTYSMVKKAVIQLIVVSVSEPKISILGANNTGRVLQCESEGWYPEPQLDWREGLKDSEGRNLSADDTQIYRGPDGRYTVRSSVTVQETHTNMFTCRVQLMKFNLKREAEFRAPERFSDSRPVVGISVGVVVLVLVIVGGVFLYLQCRNTSPQPAGSNDEDPERGEHPTQDITYHSVSGGSREGEDRGWASEAESNANSDRDSLGAERVELSTLRSDG